MMEAIVKFRQDLKDGHLCLGAGISLADPLVTDALGDSVDFFWIDSEHSAKSPEVLQGHLLAARARNVPALVRVRDSSTPFIKPVLDAGADGIIVPQVRSAAEVRAVVNDCRYAPLGRRGIGPRVPSNYGRNGGIDYLESANKNVFVSVQIENVEALDAIDDIVSVPGLDSLVLGPWDLSAALGKFGQIEHPKVAEALEMIISKAKAAGLFVGAGVDVNVDRIYSLANKGVQWIEIGEDYSYLIKCMDEVTASVRSKMARDNEGGTQK